MYLFVCEVSLRDRSYNRLRHRAFHGEAVPGDEKLYAKIPQLFVMNPLFAYRTTGYFFSPVVSTAAASRPATPPPMCPCQLTPALKL